MCEKEVQLIAIMCLFDSVCGTQNLVSSFDFQEGHLDNPVPRIFPKIIRKHKKRKYFYSFLYIVNKTPIPWYLQRFVAVHCGVHCTVHCACTVRALCKTQFVKFCFWRRGGTFFVCG